MQKIILDTNILVTALLTPAGFSSRILSEIVFARRVEICLSEAILTEYKVVLFRKKFVDKFSDWADRANALLTLLIRNGDFCEPTFKSTLIKDEPDNRFAELALEANADFLITGNSRDFTMERIGQTRIINPKDFYEGFVAGLIE